MRNQDKTTEISETEKYITDLRSFGGASHRLANLSRYADVASSSVLNGDAHPDQLTAFVSTLTSYYDRIKQDILTAAKDEHRFEIGEGMGVIPKGADIHTVAVVLDQAIAWLNGEVLPNNFERQLRLSSLKMKMEENSIDEQLNRFGGSSHTGGLYA